MDGLQGGVRWSDGSSSQGFFECNCAPPVLQRAWPASDTVALPPRLRRVSEVIAVPLDDAHVACLSPYAPRGQVLVLHRRAFRFWQTLPQEPFAPAHFPPQQQALLLRLHRWGLLSTVDGAILPLENTAFPVERMSFWIEITPRCNLDCPYCYVPKQGHPISTETARRLLPQLFRHAARQGATMVQMTYAGGEPTLAWRRLWEVHALAQNLTQEYGLHLEPVLVTNGTLLNTRRLERLAQAGFRIGFSLDGIDEHHDLHRSHPWGRSTVERVKATVLEAQSLGIPLRLINTITRMNLKGVPAFVAFAITHHLPFNLNFFRPSRWPHPLVPAAEELISTLQHAFRWIEAHLPPYRIIDGLLDRAFFGYPHLQVCSAGTGYQAINTSGHRAACPLILGQGGLDAGLQVPVVTLREPCASCAWKYWCGGGCPVLAYRAYGTPNAASPYCEVYRALYPELIRLEGLRVLRYDGQVLDVPTELPLAR